MATEKPPPQTREILPRQRQAHTRQKRINNRHRYRLKQYTCALCADIKTDIKNDVQTNEPLHNNVVHLSSYELDTLSKGLNVIPYTPFTAHCTNDELESFFRKLRLRHRYRNAPLTHEPFKHKSKRIPGPTNYKPLEDLINH